MPTIPAAALLLTSGLLTGLGPSEAPRAAPPGGNASRQAEAPSAATPRTATPGANPRAVTPVANPRGVTPAAKKTTQIEFAVTPADVVIFLDGARLGSAGEVKRVPTRPGRRLVRLERDGDATEMELDVARGKTLRFAYDFGD